eukprot:467906_1
MCVMNGTNGLLSDSCYTRRIGATIDMKMSMYGVIRHLDLDFAVFGKQTPFLYNLRARCVAVSWLYVMFYIFCCSMRQPVCCSMRQPVCCMPLFIQQFYYFKLIHILAQKKKKKKKK